MEANFPRCLDVLWPEEGGFSNRASDPGGPTNLGITIATLSEYMGRPASVSQVQGLTRETATPIYHKLIWQPIKGSYLPSGLDLMVFDTAVNNGPGRAAKFLQQALGVEPDGVIGSGTLDALSGRSASELIEHVHALRYAFDKQLPDAGGYLGWFTRIDAIAIIAQQWASGL